MQENFFPYHCKSVLVKGVHQTEQLKSRCFDLNILNWAILPCKLHSCNTQNQKGKHKINFYEAVFISKLNLKKEIAQLGD